MPSSSSSPSSSFQWTLLALLLLAGIVLALYLGPETTPLVTPDGGLTR